MGKIGLGRKLISNPIRNRFGLRKNETGLGQTDSVSKPVLGKKTRFGQTGFESGWKPVSGPTRFCLPLQPVSPIKPSNHNRLLGPTEKAQV